MKKEKDFPHLSRKIPILVKYFFIIKAKLGL